MGSPRKSFKSGRLTLDVAARDKSGHGAAVDAAAIVDPADGSDDSLALTQRANRFHCSVSNAANGRD
jgi:hypothetical protein